MSEDEAKTPRVEIIREADPLASKSTYELAEMASKELYDRLQLDRRREEVDGVKRIEVDGTFYCICELVTAGVRLTTIDALPHGMQALQSTGKTMEEARAKLYQLYADQLYVRRIIRDRMDCVRASGRAEFKIVGG